jgi:uncharacterized membrane protein YkvA (DUF1232 family)
MALVGLLATAVYLLLKLWRMLSVVRDDAMPMAGKLTFWGALAYAVFPFDFLPDPIYLDDVGVLAGAVTVLTHLASKYGITDDDADDGGAVEEIPVSR